MKYTDNLACCKVFVAVFSILTFSSSAYSQCPPTPASTPVTVNDETTDVPGSRQLVNGSGSIIDTTTAGQIKVNVSLPNSGVTPGSYTDTNISVNAQGIVTSASNGSGGGGSTTNSLTAGNLPATVPNVVVPANGLIQSLPADHTLAIGTSGTEYTVPTASSNALGICAGPDRNIWFTENNQNKIANITPVGTFSEYTIPTAASAPWGICAGPDGNLWFTENSGNKIGKITTAGTITEYSISTSNSQPTGICAGPDGNLWFTENNGNKIGKITTSGTITEYTVTTSSSQPRNICAGADGNLWFVETAGNNVASITPAGTITEYAVPTGSASPYNICTGPDGNLWFTESAVNKVGKVTTAGAFTEFTVPTSSTTPYGICAGPDGRLWFSEYATDKIASINTNGAIVEYALPSSGTGASYICVGTDGNLWLTEQSLSKVATWQYTVAGTTPLLNAITTGTGLSIARSASGLTISSNTGNTSPGRRYVMLAPVGPTSASLLLWGCGTLQTRGTRQAAVIQNNRLIMPLQATSTGNNEYVFINSTTFSNTLSLAPTSWWVFSPDVLTNVRVWAGIYNPDPHLTDTPNKTIAFRFSTSAGDTHLMAYTGDDTGGGGVHATVVDTGVTPAVNTPLLLYIDCSSGSSAKFYVDGVLKATITTTLPSSSTLMLPVIFETNLTAGQTIKPGIGSMYTEMY